MKNKILSLLASLAVIVLFSACDDHKYGSEFDRFGSVSFADFNIDVDLQEDDEDYVDDEDDIVVESRSPQKVDASDYLVSIYTKSDKPTRVLYKTFKELPGVVDLQVGNYTVIVESKKQDPSWIGAPYYMGSKDISIEEDRVTDAGSIVCSFAAVGVSMDFSTKLRPLLGDDIEITISGPNGATIKFKRDDFPKNRAKYGYFKFDSNSRTMTATINGHINGQLMSAENNNQITISNLEQGKYYILQFKVKGLVDHDDAIGTFNPGDGITIDTSVLDSPQQGNIEISDDDILGTDDRPGQEGSGSVTPPDGQTPPETPTPPVGDQNAIKVSSSTINLDGGINGVDGDSYVVNILAENGLANLKVQIVSDYLTDEFLKGVGLKTNFDLAYPEDLEEGLSGLGFPTGDGVVGQTEIDFNLTQFIPLLKLGGSMEHSFVLNIIDSKGNSVTKTLKFKS